MDDNDKRSIEKETHIPMGEQIIIKTQKDRYWLWLTVTETTKQKTTAKKMLEWNVTIDIKQGKCQ